MNRTKVFDTVRTILGRGFRQPEVDALDDALDGAVEFTGARERCPLSTSAPTAISPVGIALIKRFEGCARLRTDGLIEAYPDPASGGDPWTIGWGATGRDHFNDAPIGPGTLWTSAQCNDRLERDLVHYAQEVTEALDGASTTQSQFDALVSFHYNTGAIARATLTRKHKLGDFAGASAEFGRWNRAAGRVLKGLTRRRQAEAALYCEK